MTYLCYNIVAVVPAVEDDLMEKSYLLVRIVLSDPVEPNQQMLPLFIEQVVIHLKR